MNNYNVLDFIDSPDIREYNKDTKFTPAEQVVLIYNSTIKSINEKIDAWNYLLDTYTEGEFQVESIRCHNLEDPNRTFKDTIRAMINLYNYALHGEFSNVIYKAKFSFCGWESSTNNHYFYTYELAYEFLKQSMNEYLNNYKDEYRVNGEITRVIMEKEIDKDDIDCYMDEFKFYFNNDLKLYNIKIPQEYINAINTSYGSLENLFMYLPLPFKHGDIVKYVAPRGDIEYGTFSLDYPSKECSFAYQYGTADNTDFSWSIDTFERHYGFYHDDCNHFIFYIQRASVSELQGDDVVLKAFSAVQKGKMNPSELLEAYSGGVENLISFCQELNDNIDEWNDYNYFPVRERMYAVKKASKGKD